MSGIAVRSASMSQGALACVAVLFALIWPQAAIHAGEERYDYDALGRLIRVVDELGRVTEYDYDAAGNILAVRRVEAPTAPTVTVTALGSICEGNSRDYVLSGSGLSGLSLAPASSLIALSNVRSTSTSLAFTVTALRGISAGTLEIVGSNALGSFVLRGDVLQLLSVRVAPEPLAIPPDGQAYNARLELSAPFDGAVSVNVTVADAGIASVPEPVIGFAAGETVAPLRVIGTAEGETSLIFTSNTCVETYSSPLIVSADYQKMNRQYSLPVGVSKGDPTDPGAPQPSGPLAAPVVGVSKGDPTDPGAPQPSGPLAAPVVGVSKGDPVAPQEPLPSGPLLAPPVGVAKPE